MDSWRRLKKEKGVNQMKEYDWDEILNEMKKFARIEDITDIIIIGDKDGEMQGVRRLVIGEDD